MTDYSVIKGLLISMKLFNKPENKERCGSGYIPLKAWSCCDIAPSNEEEAVGWWAGVLKTPIKC